MGGNLQTIQPKKYYTREQFTWEEKEDICAKSDNMCCHCGKKIYAGYGATIDHFIPLNKGGSNQMINLIPLCKECNDNKEDKLYNIDYIVHIKDKYRKEISDYLNSYIQVMDYVQRHRFLAYDEYQQEVFIVPNTTTKHKRNKNKQQVGIRVPYTLKYATWNDLDKMQNYLVKYLKKNNVLDNIEAARENIIFWMQFGCIYYIEKNNEVTAMFAITVKQLDSDYRGIINQPMLYVFPYYQTKLSEQIVLNTIYDLPKIICDENGLKFVPINLVMLEKEPMKNCLSYMYNTEACEDTVVGFIVFHIIVGENEDYENIHKEYNELNDAERKTYDFFNKFSDVTDKMLEYFEKYEDRESVAWMINSILSPEAIKASKLSKYVNFTGGE